MALRWSSLRRPIAAGCALILAIAAILPTLAVVLPGEALAQRRGVSLVRDAEIENTIRAYAVPLLAAAGLTADSVQVHLVNDRSLNAFVAGGQRIFVHTGLLQRAEPPAQVIGVLAHEIGHISGGHLSRLEDSLGNASALMIASMLLGVAAGVASGNPDAAVAGILAGQQIAERNFLSFTRGQEAAADQAGANFLDSTQQSIMGLVEFMKILANQEALQADRQDPYVRTHPLSADRVAALTARAEQSRYAKVPDNPENIERFKRMQAKLMGYLDGLGATLRKYPESDTSHYARYARAFAYFRALDFTRAQTEVNSLIAEFPNDPFYHELKGDILIDMGNVRDALQPHRRAHELGPREPLLAYGYARVLVALEDNSLLPEAVTILKDVVQREPESSAAWQQLAIAYGRSGDIGMASLASAERYLIEGALRDAQGQAERAQRLLKEGTPGWLRAQDVIAAAKDRRREMRNR
ncbi:M48 family metalloprotease [Ferrovibrio sp.]|uniref:M48 family metalloprotease n=1 Tax=Ferrovibrio sp. TaxID=1917215 RepID=UPI003D11A30C